jgi:hypothetical protein
MAPSGKKSLKSSVAIAKLVTKLKSSDSIADLIQRLDENSINHLVGVIANLMHNKGLQQHPLLARKLKRLKNNMRGSAREWSRLVHNPLGCIKAKRRTLVKQAGTGSLWQIISSVLPVLLSLLL